MKKEKQKSFVRRVSQANRTELLVVTYDIIIEEFEEALEYFELGDINEYRRSLKSAQRYIAELMSTLDYSYSISRSLLSLYEYVQRVTVKADISGSPSELEGAIQVIRALRTSYSEIAGQDNSEPLMGNAQTVYAGLTYGRNSLNETSIDQGRGRGFLA